MASTTAYGLLSAAALAGWVLPYCSEEEEKKTNARKLLQAGTETSQIYSAITHTDDDLVTMTSHSVILCVEKRYSTPGSQFFL